MTTDKSRTNATRRNVLIGGIGFACAGLAFAGARETDIEPLPEGALEKLFPQRLGKWQSVDGGGVIVPAESELSERTYNDVLIRVYHDGGSEAVAMCLAYGSSQSRDMQLHRPEACYPAAGFAIESSEPVSLAMPGRLLVPATLLETQSQSRKEQVLYWTRVGNEFPTTPLAQRLAVVRQNLEGSVPDGMLARASTIRAGTAEALPVLENFMSELVAAVSPEGRKLLVGTA